MRCWIATIGIVLVVFCCSSERVESQTEADWDWTNKEFGPILDTLMPPEAIGGLYLTYRSHKDYVTSVPEYWFRIGYEFNEKQGYGRQNFYTAHVRIANPNSIYDQLMALHRNDPATQEASGFKSRIKLRSYDLTEMSCPAIKTQMDKFAELQTKMPDLNGGVITIHPTIHAFYAQGGEGDMRIVLTDEGHPLVKWALQTRRALEDCVNRIK
jgi:hypothetical protein